MGGETILGASYFILWNFHSELRFYALLCRNWPFSAANCLTLQVALYLFEMPRFKEISMLDARTGPVFCEA
jgi:hypothetical protein